ncbi:MAG: hypothetical protein HY786_06535 [Deltaproteobacteria bacterium]|nr:hypothetical protein [Deltaproteobacteria bacterium]
MKGLRGMVGCPFACDTSGITPGLYAILNGPAHPVRVRIVTIKADKSNAGAFKETIIKKGGRHKPSPFSDQYPIRLD